MTTKNTCARVLAPEDIARGDYIAVLHFVSEETPTLFGAESTFIQPRVARMTLMSWDTDPKRVIEVCLPFILVEEPDATRTTLDARRFRLARVSKRFGKAAFEKLDKDRGKEEDAPARRRKHKRR